MIESKAVKKSSAPLFLSFDVDPNCDDPGTVPCTAKQMQEVLSHASDYEPLWGFEHGEIACELVPLGFVYKNEQGLLVDGEVSAEKLIDMLLLQAAVDQGEIPPIEKDKTQETANRKPGCPAGSMSAHDISDAYREFDEPLFGGIGSVEKMLFEYGYCADDVTFGNGGTLWLHDFGIFVAPVMESPDGQPLYDLNDLSCCLADA